MGESCEFSMSYGDLMNLFSLVVSKKLQADPHSASPLVEVYGCDLDPKTKEMQSQKVGDPLTRPLPLFARFKLRTESSSLPHEFLTITPQHESSDFNASEELKSMTAKRESFCKDN